MCRAWRVSSVFGLLSKILLFSLDGETMRVGSYRDTEVWIYVLACKMSHIKIRGSNGSVDVYCNA